jgi:serine/threonine protein phosphatase PrpC
LCIFRKQGFPAYKAFHASPLQELGGAPYQFIAGAGNLTNPDYLFTMPAHGSPASIPLVSGDVILVGSDGIFDNIELNQLCAILSRTKETNFVQSFLVDVFKVITNDWRKYDDLSAIAIKIH